MTDLKPRDRVVIIRHDRVGVVQEAGTLLKVAVTAPNGRRVTLDLDPTEVIPLGEALNG